MADVGLDFDFLVASARRSIDEVRLHPRLQRRAEDRGSALVTHVEHTLNLLDDEIAVAKKRFRETHSVRRQSAIGIQLRFYNRLARGVHSAMPWLDKAADPPLDLGVIYFIDEAANALVGSDCDVIAVADSDYMYSAVSWPFYDVLTKHLGQPAPMGTRPIVLSFPSREGHTSLLHPLFAHELGHAACDAHGLVAQAFRECEAQSWFARELDLASGDYSSRRGGTVDQARYWVEELVRKWLEELLCDALALDYLGPTFVFGFAAFLLATRWNEPSETHPPATLRIRLLMSQLQTRGWSDLVRARAPRILEWLADAAGTPLGALQPQYNKFVYDSCQASTDTVQRLTASRLGVRRWEPKHFEAVEPAIAELFQHRILPVATRDGGAFDRRAIFLAGWLHLFATEGSAPEFLVEGLSRDSLREPLARALEMSVVLTTWQSTSVK